MASVTTSSPLRRRRLECGLTQTELAARAGVSRQLVAAVEAGQNAPAVDAALRLAGALAASVEELFSPAPLAVVPALGGRLRDGAPLKVGRIGDRLVAAELADHGAAGAAWAQPDGTLESGVLRLFAGATPAGFVIAGCDPALGVAESMLHGLGSRSLLAISTTTGAALGALRSGRVHAAVVHGPWAELPAPPVPVVRLQLARWQVGLATSPKLARESLEAFLVGDAPIVQRDPGAASQQALERTVARLGVDMPSPRLRAAGHIDAARTAAMLDCAAVTTEAAADAFGLRFLALEGHTVQIWLARQWVDHPGASALGDLLVSAGFRERVEQFRGYDLVDCGTRYEPRRPRSEMQEGK
jgi:transcriptional regulator with XRE-family HTH domain/molybdate-binding protein